MLLRRALPIWLVLYFLFKYAAANDVNVLKRPEFIREGLSAKLEPVPGSNGRHFVRHPDDFRVSPYIDFSYDAVVHEDFVSLDEIMSIISVNCSHDGLLILFDSEHSRDSTVNSWRQGTILHGGREWGCHEHSKSGPTSFTRKVVSSSTTSSKSQAFVQTQKANFLDCFENISVSFEDKTPKKNLDKRDLGNNIDNVSISAKPQVPNKQKRSSYITIEELYPDQIHAYRVGDEYLIGIKVDSSIVNPQGQVLVYFVTFQLNIEVGQTLVTELVASINATLLFNFTVPSSLVSDQNIYSIHVCYNSTQPAPFFACSNSANFTVPSILVDITSKGPYKAGDIVSFQIDTSNLQVANTIGYPFLYQYENGVSNLTDTFSPFNISKGEILDYSIPVGSDLESNYGYFLYIDYQCYSNWTYYTCISASSPLFFVPVPVQHQWNFSEPIYDISCYPTNITLLSESFFEYSCSDSLNNNFPLYDFPPPSGITSGMTFELSCTDCFVGINFQFPKVLITAGTFVGISNLEVQSSVNAFANFDFLLSSSFYANYTQNFNILPSVQILHPTLLVAGVPIYLSLDVAITAGLFVDLETDLYATAGFNANLEFEVEYSLVNGLTHTLAHPFQFHPLEASAAGRFNAILTTNFSTKLGIENIFFAENALLPQIELDVLYDISGLPPFDASNVSVFVPSLNFGKCDVEHLMGVDVIGSINDAASVEIQLEFMSFNFPGFPKYFPILDDNLFGPSSLFIGCLFPLMPGQYDSNIYLQITTSGDLLNLLSQQSSSNVRVLPVVSQLKGRFENVFEVKSYDFQLWLQSCNTSGTCEFIIFPTLIEIPPFNFTVSNVQQMLSKPTSPACLNPLGAGLLFDLSKMVTVSLQGGLNAISFFVGSPPPTPPLTSSPTSTTPATTAPPTSSPTSTTPVTTSPPTYSPTSTTPATTAPPTYSPTSTTPATTAPPTYSPTSTSPAATSPPTYSPTSSIPSAQPPTTTPTSTSLPTSGSPLSTNKNSASSVRLVSIWATILTTMVTIMIAWL